MAKNMLGSRINGGNTAYTRNASDYYPTPPDATNALLDHLKLPPETCIWEPACGEGHMAKVMTERGYLTFTSDLNYQGFGEGGVDFLTFPLVDCVDWIITNPPFKLAEAFIRRCAEHKKPFALLLKTQFWHAKSRYALFNEIRPAEILPLTWRPDFLFKARGKGSPLMDCIWCTWRGPTNKTIYIPLTKGGPQ